MNLRHGSSFKIGHFDIETRRVGFFTAGKFRPDGCEPIAIALSWANEKKVAVKLLGECESEELLTWFADFYREADVVTGHYIRCMVPETRVLTADLRWTPAGDLVVGDRLLAFDEHRTPGKKRGLAFATVTAAQSRKEQVYAVELKSGEVLYATAEHPWFASTRSGSAVRHIWRRTDELLGAEPKTPGHFAKQAVRLYKAYDPWAPDTSYEAGWLAGFFDGEGSLSYAGSGLGLTSLTAAQNAGPLLTQAERFLQAKGFATCCYQRGREAKIHSIRVNGGMGEMARFLGQIRPTRLLNKWQAQESLASLQQLRSEEVVRVTPVGEREIAALATSTATYIAEGYAVHNSFDLPILAGAMLEHQLPGLPPKLSSDTHNDLTRRAGLSASQENLAAMYELSASKEPVSDHAWRNAARLDPKAMQKVRKRVVMDVKQHKQLRERLIEANALKPPRVWFS